jgi:hypothetical protein
VEKKKQIIRLTESDLHQIIKESVNKILTELDPRTYASAAQKRNLQGNTNAAQKLTKQSAKSWNKQYGSKDGDFELQNNGTFKKRNMSLNGKNVNTEEYLDNGFQNQANYNHIDRYTFNPDTVQHHRDYFYNDDRKKGVFDNQFINNNDFSTDDEGLKVAQQMANGKGEYVKGKGWK